ncbi:MAG: PBS lyase HEAT-like repeat protein [bacterium ADurb.Bin429]|nr:MAG: PBS lyase HEAT-like repeat protein [bacterium ADurb.Bin429]
MGCSVDALRRKLTDPASPLAPWWRHVLALAKHDPVWYSPYTVLAAVVTEEPEYLELARQFFLRYVEYRAEGEISNEAQYHTHTVTAPLGRRAIWYDWLADLNLFSAAEDAAIRETLLDSANIFALQHLQSRIRSFDNQIMANAFAAAAVGYVLGFKRGNSALGRRLYASGLSWLHELLGALPVGGYSPEGSAYHEQVVLPLTMLSGLLIEETTGTPVFTRGVAPANRPVQLLLETSRRMIGPGGLLPAWDAYGFQAATIKSGLVYLARLTGDLAPLAIIRDQDMWYRTALPAWEIDDRLWTLVWWPEEMAADATAVYPSWLIPDVAGALHGAECKVRLFQYWDECGGVPTSGRSQVDPNNLTLEAFGSPLLLDGHGTVSTAIIPLPVEPITAYVGTRTLETVQEYLYAAWGAEIPLERAVEMAMDGSVGLANALVFDDEPWYVPLAPRRGHGEALHDAGPLQVVRGNATEYYTDRYDVSRVTRTSALVRGRYVVVTDRVNAESPHSLTWQAYLRPEAALEEGHAVITTPEQVHGDVIPLQDGTLTLTEVDGYPRFPGETRSLLMRHTVAAGNDVRLDVALAPQSLLDEIADLTDSWERRIGAHNDVVSLRDAYLSDPGDEQDQPRYYRRTVSLEVVEGRCMLEVAKASHTLTVRVNGQALPATTRQFPGGGGWSGAVSFLPWFFDVTSALHVGENTIELIAPYFHGETVCGPVRLHAVRAPQPTRAERTGLDTLRITFAGETDELVLEREGGLAPWAGGKTDARYAVLTADGQVSAAEMTRLSLPNGLRIHSQAPCDLVWTSDALVLAVLTESATVHVAWNDGWLFVERSGCVYVQYSGTSTYQLRLRLQEARPVVVNGTPIGIHGGPEAPEVALDLEPVSASAPPPASPDEVYTLAEQCGEAAAPLIVAALESEDWRVQMAAADVAGRLRLVAAVPALLSRFAEAETELPYPELGKWWRISKMRRNPDFKAGPDPSLPMPLAVKRWRVKRAVVTALGKIGDTRAVAPLEQALARCTDFFPVTSQLGVALGRLGSPTSIPVLERHLHHKEVNTRMHARLALQLLTGEIDRATFEAQVNPG